MQCLGIKNQPVPYMSGRVSPVILSQVLNPYFPRVFPLPQGAVEIPLANRFPPYFFNELFPSHRCFSTSASLSRQAVSLTALQPPLKLTALTVTRARARTATPGTLATNPHSHPQKCVGPWDASISPIISALVRGREQHPPIDDHCVGPRTRAMAPLGL